ncbi:ribosomal protein S18-alanine N-acetyltransferase [Methylogaea oryzae]|nr:ribosomal protein S18-alanine N-acetyltransferase [Methylogaea oryzae]
MVEIVSYDAEREFYAKHNPSILENELFFRPMRKSDLKAVAAIEAAAYEFPWSEATFGDCLKVGYQCWVGEHMNAVAAYGILSVAVGEGQIMNLCVSPHIHGKGYGRKMLQKLIDDAAARKAETVFLEVRPSNKPARRLYESMGFNEVGLRKGYYPARNGREDALLLALSLYMGD